jgi:hypothetical protein
MKESTLNNLVLPMIVAHGGPTHIKNLVHDIKKKINLK